MDRDFLHPTLETERKSNKLKQLGPTLNPYFMEVKCGGCNETAVIFSYVQTVTIERIFSVSLREANENLRREVLSKLKLDCFCSLFNFSFI